MMKNTREVTYFEQKTKITGGKPEVLPLKKSESLPFGKPVTAAGDIDIKAAREKTMAYKILRRADMHSGSKKDGSKQDDNKQDGSKVDSSGRLSLKFDALISHDITYVSIVQAARASGMTQFPIPYVLTNCHNSLCAVGGTINEDDHAFGLSAAMKYGGIYVPANQAVIHQYAREMLAGCGKMILGSDSHTRYGCFGTLAIGEGGGELVKQLLEHTYDIDEPDVTLVWLEGTPKKGIGPHDVALAIIAETFPKGKVKNKILEFAGPGIKSLTMDFRAGIDVMTTETSCLSSIWETDGTVLDYYKAHGRESDFSKLSIEEGACYDSLITVDLSQVESMIALPFHPSKALTIHKLQDNPGQILKQAQEECNNELSSGTKLDLLGCINKKGEVTCEQGIIAGCAGGLFENISEAADILDSKTIGNSFFDLSVYPASTPIWLEISKQGIAEGLLKSGTVIKSAFCGPCFGAGDTPAHNTLSIRHTTRNFASREGSKPAQGQISAVALMDARSIAATAISGGVLTAATDIGYSITERGYSFDSSIYQNRCYNGYGKPDVSEPLRMGPNITDWPAFAKLQDNILLKLCAVIDDEVTTTDELIPSGDTSSYRSNPVKLAEFTLSRRVPGYAVMSRAVTTEAGMAEADSILKYLNNSAATGENTTTGSCIFAKKPGDGSAREQAASCQRVLGGRANICYEYATKRYRSNCINWGILPFTIGRDEAFDYQTGDWVFAGNILTSLLAGDEKISAKVIKCADGRTTGPQYNIFDIELRLENLSASDRKIIAEGCLMNFMQADRSSTA